MALKTLICAIALIQAITGQNLNSNIRGLNGNGMASSILASNSLLNSGLASGLSSGLASGLPSGLSSGLASGLPSGLASGLPSGLANGLASGAGCSNVAGNSISSSLSNCGGVASTGGSLTTQSASPSSPNGIQVVSDNGYEGGLCVGGNLPILGTVALEGTLSNGGQGSVSYGCGSGSVGIVSEGPISTGITSPGCYAPNLEGLGSLGYARPGCGPC